jgi:hypothetical protein
MSESGNRPTLRIPHTVPHFEERVERLPDDNSFFDFNGDLLVFHPGQVVFTVSILLLPMYSVPLGS